MIETKAVRMMAPAVTIKEFKNQRKKGQAANISVMFFKVSFLGMILCPLLKIRFSGVKAFPNIQKTGISQRKARRRKKMFRIVFFLSMGFIGVPRQA
jgi:predicted membrane channel-forming protein YqfA (hemolysin III family)